MLCQENILSNKLTLPKTKLYWEFKNYAQSKNPHININNSGFHLSYNVEFISNSGHPNIDNFAELYSLGPLTRLTSFRYSYYNSWLTFEIEPYIIHRSNNFDDDSISGSYQFLNNHINKYSINSNAESGFKQTRAIIHYKGIGLSYGIMSHWWSPAFHSSIVLSTNAPSQETYAIGTFKDIKINKFSFGSQIIVLPYTNFDNNRVYFSGLKSHIIYNSNPEITFGFYRTFLSGNFSNLSDITMGLTNWDIKDAALLVIEPLFGQSKSGLSYTVPGTPGFDAWDEILSGFIKLRFPDDYLEIYIELASDDNRGNIVDLKAHWDHTLGYILGIKKFYNINSWAILLGAEYLSTKVSNTFAPNFFRGNPNINNYYDKPAYDYFSYKGRRMGAHSGSSSDDLIYIVGIGKKNSMLLISYNIERHGIKSKLFNEKKSEFSVSYNFELSDYHSFFISLEYETIKNFGFIQNKFSDSKLIWLGYSFSI